MSGNQDFPGDVSIAGKLRLLSFGTPGDYSLGNMITTSQATPGDTNEDVLAVFPVLPNTLGPNGQLRSFFSMLATNNANNKTVRFRYSAVPPQVGTVFSGGTLIAQVVAPSTLSLAGVLLINNRNATNSQTGVAFGIASGAFISGPTASAIDTTLPSYLVVTGQKALAGDAFSLESMTMELFIPS